MIYGDLQFFDIIVFAAVAVFLIYRLRSVLGKRTGHQDQSRAESLKPKTPEIINKKTPQLKDSEEKLSTVYENIEGFDHKNFLEGAKKAFEIIITAYNQGDKKGLKDLVSKNVFLAFEKAIEEKKNDPNSQFYSLVIDSVENAVVENKIIKITINFISEQFKNNDESSIQKNRDTWTFEKNINSKSNAWILTST